MSQVEFDEENEMMAQGSLGQSEQQEGGLIGMVIKLGLAKNKNQANIILIIVAVIALALMVYFLMA